MALMGSKPFLEVIKGKKLVLAVKGRKHVENIKIIIVQPTEGVNIVEMKANEHCPD